MTGLGLPARRGYQDQAVAAILDGLAGGGRGTVVLACGTGKTLVAVHAALQMLAAGLVVVACPSLTLVAQTLGVWSGAGVADAVLAVCSDFGELRAFHTEHGHFLVPDGTRLAHWMHTQRRLYHKRILDPQRIAALDGLGFEWTPQQRAQERGLAAARAFHAEHAHLRVPENYPSAGINLCSWLAHQRHRNTSGTLPADLKAELTRLGMRWEKPDRVTWQDAYDLATAFYAEHQHLRPPTGHRINGFDLYFWLCQQRGRHRSGKLSADRSAALNAIGMVWDLDEARWEDSFAAAVTFARRERYLKPPQGHREGDINVYAWLIHQRKLHRQGSLSTERISRLTSIGISW